MPISPKNTPPNRFKQGLAGDTVQYGLWLSLADPVAAEIAAGFAYLHRKNILYRDTKPQNIGLDHNGHAKIFDLGLAKELHDGDRRKHTGNCGTKRYMSPECGRFEHYGLSSDVYSFSLLLWEILSLERPFAKLTAKDFSDKVYYGNKRPNILMVPADF